MDISVFEMMPDNETLITVNYFKFSYTVELIIIFVICVVEQSKKVPQWNFWKYLVSHEGQVLEAWGPWVDPDKLFNTISHAVNDAIAADSGNDESSQQLFSRDKEL